MCQQCYFYYFNYYYIIINITVSDCNTINNRRTTQDLLAQILLEKNADIVIITEQYRDDAGTGWDRDELGTAPIWISDPQNQPVAQHR